MIKYTKARIQYNCDFAEIAITSDGKDWKTCRVERNPKYYAPQLYTVIPKFTEFLSQNLLEVERNNLIYWLGFAMGCKTSPGDAKYVFLTIGNDGKLSGEGRK